jgi:SAM-dependent methyltransferase
VRRHDRLRIAEIGCGEGGLLAWIAENVPGASVTGYELNREAAAYGRERGLNITSDYISPSDRYDAIILEQVLEHVADLHAFLGAMSATQRPGDLLYVGVPGILNAGSGYQSNFISYLEYGHLFHFCLHTLERALARHSYRFVAGDEVILAVFEKDTAPPLTLRSPSIDPAQVKNYIGGLERDFRRHNGHLKQRWRCYLKYILIYAGFMSK